MTSKTSDHATCADHAPDWFGVEIDQLSARLRFNPVDGQIWLESERMMLLHVAAFSSLRQELIERFGMLVAREVLHRMGEASGMLDAAIARRAMPHAGPLEAFKTGPRLHAIQGMVAPEQVRLEHDAQTGLHVGEWIWHNSVEADAHIAAFGLSTEPVCWTLNGYASAYSSAFVGQPTIYKEVECRAMGASHCRIIGKPLALWDRSELDSSAMGLNLSAEKQAPWLGERIDAVHPSSDGGDPSDGWLIGESPAFAGMMSVTRQVAAVDAPVLILGEPGVGKKAIGQMIHRLSKRQTRPLLEINCARQDSDDLLLDLFGRERSGDQPARPGKLERQGGGTLLVEDIQFMSPQLQARLMHLLVNHQVERQGSSQPRTADVRVIACANDELGRAVREGRFRQDLYYRLSVCPIAVPPLRNRRGDLPLLIRHFVEKHAATHRKPLAGLTMDALSYLLNHDFPGNIAEIDAMMERAVILAPTEGMIRTGHLLSEADLHQPTFFRLSGKGELVHTNDRDDLTDVDTQTERLLRGDFCLASFERELIQRAVAQADGNLSQAARMLGLTRPQLAYRYNRLQNEEDGASPYASRAGSMHDPRDPAGRDEGLTDPASSS